MNRGCFRVDKQNWTIVFNRADTLENPVLRRVLAAHYAGSDSVVRGEGDDAEVVHDLSHQRFISDDLFDIECERLRRIGFREV